MSARRTFPVVRFVYAGRQAVAEAAEGRPYTVVYDGVCRVCNRLVDLLRRWDRRGELELVPFQDTSVMARFPWIPPEEYARAMQLVGPGGHTWQGAAAVEKLLDVLPYGGALGWIFDLPLVGALFDRFYRWFARNRYRFGCGDHCASRSLSVDYGDGA